MQIKSIQEIIDKIRGKHKNSLKKFMERNTLSIPKGIDTSKLHIGIVGKNNTIKIARGVNISGRFTINGYMDDSVIEIGENFSCGDVHFQLGQNHKNFGKIKNVNIKIDSNLSWESGSLETYNSNSCVDIGTDCMFAGNVTLFNTDAHPIFDAETNELINKVKGMNVGNHVWLGMNSTVLKNSFVSDNSVVGWGSVYSKNKETRTNCAFAGNPAKIVKENINWDKNGAKCGYIGGEKR